MCNKVDLSISYDINAVNGNRIRVYGLKTVCVDFGLGKNTWNMIVADVDSPIIGADFLSNFHLIPDLTRKLLIDGRFFTSVKCYMKHSQQSSIHLVTIAKKPQIDSRVVHLLEKFPDLIKPPKYCEKPHDTMHYIETTGQPVYQRPYRLPQRDLEEVTKEYRETTRIGVTRPSKSQWASPLVIVNKHGKKRYCGNYRRLNAQTTPDRYPIPNITDCSNKLHNMKCFSKLDLVKAYWNIPVYPPHIEKTAVVSPAGLFEYLRMPFGLRNAPSTWMRFIVSVLGDLPFIFIYFDDILVFAENEELHLKYLEILLQRLNEYNLTINEKKSCFLCSDLEFLGYKISEHGLEPTGKRVEYIRELQPPKTVGSLRRILGIFSFYRRFVKNAAQLLAPFYNLLKGKIKKNDRTVIKWTPELHTAFDEVKLAFQNYTLLNFLNDRYPLQLVCDASGTAIGGVLEQLVDGELKPIAFYSEKLKDNQMNWCVYDKELYAVFACIRNFEHLIRGYDLTIVTDHRPLVNMFTTKKRILLERRSRQIEFISQFTTSIRHISGSSNVVADAISRPEVAAIQKTLSLKDIADAQLADEDILNLQKNSKYEVSKVVFKEENCSVLCVSDGNIQKILLPKSLRYSVFEHIHGVSHPSGRVTNKLIEKTYFWPMMQRDIRRWSRCCDRCQKAKISRHTKSPFGNYKICDRFEHVHMDIIVLPEVSGFRYVISFIDRSTRWVESKPLKKTEAEDVAKVFIEEWVSRHGVPAKLTSDRGPQFRSKLFGEICQLLGVDTVKTTSYNPKSNGIVERMQKVLKNSLKCRGKNWLDDLPFVLLGLRTVIREDVGVSAAEMMYGCSLRLPGEFFVAGPSITNESAFVQQLRTAMAKMRPPPFKHKNNVSYFVSPDLFTAKKVYVRIDRVKEPLELPYEGPYEVIQRRKKYFKLRLPKKDDFVSIDRLKPAYELTTENIASSESLAPTSILKKTNFDAHDEVKQTGNLSNKGKRILYVRTHRPQVTFAQSPIVIADQASDVIQSSIPPSASQRDNQSVQVDRQNSYVTKRSGRQIKTPGRYRS